jgi:hypothetical protein
MGAPDAVRNDTYHRFTVWVHRSAYSIFGARSGPVERDGLVVTFDDEPRARMECDRLNAGPGDPFASYSVKSELTTSVSSR